MSPGFAGGEVAMLDGAEGALNGADVGVVEDGDAGIFGINTDVHCVPPCLTGEGGEPSRRLLVSLSSSAAI
jgi:hypothetical protein